MSFSLFSGRLRPIALACATGATAITTVVLTLEPATARCLASNQWAYGSCGRSYSGGGGGGANYVGAGIAAAGIAIELAPVAIDILGNIASSVGDGVGGISAGTNLGPTQQEIYDNITGSTPVLPFNIFQQQQTDTAPAEPQQTAEQKLPPGCAGKSPVFGSFASRGTSAYNEALQAGRSSDESFAVSDPDSYRDAAAKAREAAEDFRCAKNENSRQQALKLARQLDARANKRKRDEAKKMIDTANKFWFNPKNRKEVDQIKYEIESMKSKGMSNKKIIQTLKGKGYTNDDIKTAIGEMQEAKANQ
ncbi:MAG: hypothetical protein AB7O50_03635 [Pseudolabrys sp.]